MCLELQNTNYQSIVCKMLHFVTPLLIYNSEISLLFAIVFNGNNYRKSNLKKTMGWCKKSINSEQITGDNCCYQRARKQQRKKTFGELDEPKLYSPRVYCIYILQTFQCNLKILVAAIRVYNTIHSAIPIYHLSLFLTILYVEKSYEQGKNNSDGESNK